MVRLTPFTRSVIVGLILSDGWLIISNSTNARLGFAQSVTNSDYFWFVFFSLAHYCSSLPIIRNRTNLNKQNVSLDFKTRLMPCLTELHTLFYPNGTKVIPYNIYELLTPIALAHLIMGDGSAQRHGLIICTDCYCLEDVVRLINVLIIRYRVECTIRVPKKNQYRIYTRERSVPLIRQIVKPHMCASMVYKLKL